MQLIGKTKIEDNENSIYIKIHIFYHSCQKTQIEIQG